MQEAGCASAMSLTCPLPCPGSQPVVLGPSSPSERPAAQPDRRPGKESANEPQLAAEFLFPVKQVPYSTGARLRGGGAHCNLNPGATGSPNTMVRYRVRSPSERPHKEYGQLVNWQEQGRDGQEEQGLSSEGAEVYARTHRGCSRYRRRRCSRRRLYRTHRRRSRSCRRRRRRSCRYRRRPRRGLPVPPTLHAPDHPRHRREAGTHPTWQRLQLPDPRPHPESLGAPLNQIFLSQKAADPGGGEDAEGTKLPGPLTHCWKLRKVTCPGNSK
ncbi:hypothetical protein P7K49_023036 [Saguinus oedipus]|uniref:Protamine-2 n=1 Tax=Saguinus oedipus TaxID=9490 RepID=A0ABQ9ULD4_SAGOE|nr:hypothetical protein P7K49_023036 [Saguinus oedipus]